MCADLRNSPFTILGVEENCTDADVKQAYRRLAMRYHPDRNQDPGAEAEFKRIKMAYQLISTAAGRALLRRILVGARDKRPRQRQHTPPPPKRTAADPPKGVPGSKPFNEERLQPAKKVNASGLTFSLLYMIVFFFINRLRLERLPLQLLVLVPPALVCMNISRLDNKLSFGDFGQGLLFGCIFAVVSDGIIDYIQANNRYNLRTKLNNMLGYTFIFSAAALLVSIEISGTAIVPQLFRIDGEWLRAVLWTIFGSGVYLWFIYCFMLQKQPAMYDTIFMWFWLIGLEYIIIVVFRYRLG